MYYPYLRSKKNEMLALQELIPLFLKKKEKVSPVIEPVSDSPTLRNTLKSFKQSDINFNIIINPSVGDLIEDIEQTISLLEQELTDYENYQLAIIVENSSIDYYKEIIEEIKKSSLKFKGYTLIHNIVLKDIATFLKVFDKPVLKNIINLSKTNSDRLYKDRFDKGTQICLDDYFKSQNRNSDYLGVDSSSFSKDYAVFQTEGYSGFGDFLTLGDIYSETGFTPFAVAIHVTFKDLGGDLMVKHFVSDSNGDRSDSAGKFFEANNKLCSWIYKEKIPATKGIDTLKELYKTKHYPGLGVLKKLSIMNHIETILNNI